MVGSMKLADEILANASVIPVECQEHILDVIKAILKRLNKEAKDGKKGNRPVSAEAPGNK